MPFVKRNGISLCYELTKGDRPPVLLLHGWCCDQSFLAPQAAHFARQGHTVLTVDLRGHGRSDKPEHPYPISVFTEDVVWICDILTVRKPIIVGHSMGGIIAYDLAARWPDLPAAIVMIDSAVVLPNAAHAAIAHEVERLRETDYASELRRIMEASFFLPTDSSLHKKRILETMTATAQHVMVSAYEGLGQYDAAAAGSVTVPSAYVAANEPTPRSNMVQLRQLLPQMFYGQTVGSGHFCQLEVPEQVNAMIDRFLAVGFLA